MISDLMERMRALVFRRRERRELRDEMRFHIDRDAAERVRLGADPATAQREALVAFGGVDNYMEQSRDASGVRPVDDIIADTRFALRALRRNPGFTLTVVTVLGLAIGATTAVFAVVHAVLIADLPYPEANRLVRVFEQTSPTNRYSVSGADVLGILEHQKSFDAIGGLQFTSPTLTGFGNPESIFAPRATGGFYVAMSARAATGRMPESRDDIAGAPAVVTVSHSFAESHLGGAAVAVGKSITLDGLSHEVVGVMPAGVQELGGLRAQLWRPFQIPQPRFRGPFGLAAIGRLRPGVTLEAASHDLASVSRKIYAKWSGGGAGQDDLSTLTPYTLRESIVGNSGERLWPFGVAVMLVLLVAIANVATLTLVRASSRAHELGVRATLGASRARLARLVVTESIVLTSLAGAMGAAVAFAGIRIAAAVAPSLPRVGDASFGWRAVAVAAFLALASGVLVSLSPVAAVVAGRLASWRDDARRSGGGRWTSRIRGILVGAEFALALPLLLGAALLANTFLRLQRVDLGYDSATTFRVVLPLPPRYATPADVETFWRRAEQRTLETPGVVAAGVSTAAPPDNQGNTDNFNLTAHPVPAGTPEPQSPWSAANPGFFEAMGIPLLDGRWFTATDSGNGAPVVLVSRTWAQRYFPNERAVGQTLVQGGCVQCPLTTIVGVVGDVKYQGLIGDGEGVYNPMSQQNGRSGFLFVRATGAPDAVMRQVIEGLRGIDPMVPYTGRTMRAQLERALADPGRWTAILWSFAASALLLSAVGIFGLLSYLVRRQQREIGVRIALGAEPGAVRRMILANGMRFVVPGTAVGLGLAFIAMPWLASMLYGVTPYDPLTMVAVTAGLLGLAALASLVPAIRASRIRPIEAINSE
jgi:putative ABC transport system permease protein